MAYKVFLVEDEIVTREGIRDNVDWKSARCEFCGEASDGETALALIESSKPDILITDIKMPFMDGLQLSKIIRKHMPWIKIIILSGHDEFEYAQAALKIGVTEYLLKPISSEDLNNALEKITLLLDQESKEQKSFIQLQKEAEGNLATLREKFLLRLVMGGVSSADAIEQSQQLGLEIIAPYYLVLLLKIEFCDSRVPFDYQVYQRVEQAVSNLVGSNQDILLTKKGLEEFVFILTGDDSEHLEQAGNFWEELIRREVDISEICKIIIKQGTPQQRLGDIHHSFVEALYGIKSADKNHLPIDSNGNTEKFNLLKLERPALENYLKFGDSQDYENFFSQYLKPVYETAFQTDFVKNYFIIDIMLTISQFISDLGANGDHEPPKINDLEQLLEKKATFEQTSNLLRNTIINALKIRDDHVNHERLLLIQQAKAYIDQNYCDPDLRMNKVAAKFNLSSGYFSTLFSKEIGESFRNYLNKHRIDHAKELLRTTNLKCSEIAYQSGYNDAHYFSTIFKTNTGFSPQQYRAQPQIRKK